MFSRVEVRLLRFWETRDIRGGDELMLVDLLLLDSNATLMPTSSSSRVPTFAPITRSMYSITRVDVAPCNPNFRLSDSPLLIQFSYVTSLNVLIDPTSPLPEDFSGFLFKARCFLYQTPALNSRLCQ